jgi:hypothetical protein
MDKVNACIAQHAQKRLSVLYIASFSMLLLVENVHPKLKLYMVHTDVGTSNFTSADYDRPVRVDHNAAMRVIMPMHGAVLSAYVGESSRMLIGFVLYEVRKPEKRPLHHVANDRATEMIGMQQRTYFAIAWTAPTSVLVRYGIDFFAVHGADHPGTERELRLFLFILINTCRGLRGKLTRRIHPSPMYEHECLGVHGYISLGEIPVFSVSLGSMAQPMLEQLKHDTFGYADAQRIPSSVSVIVGNMHSGYTLQQGHCYVIRCHYQQPTDMTIEHSKATTHHFDALSRMSSAMGVIMYRILSPDGKKLERSPYLVIFWRISLEHSCEDIRCTASVLRDVDFHEPDVVADRISSLPNIYAQLHRTRSSRSTPFIVTDEYTDLIDPWNENSVYSVAVEVSLGKDGRMLDMSVVFAKESQVSERMHTHPSKLTNTMAI